MTARHPAHVGGTSVEQYPNFRIGATFDEALAAYCNSTDVDQSKVAIVGHNQGDDERWAFGNEDLLVMLTDQAARKLGVPRDSRRAYGKPLVFAQGAGVPSAVSGHVMATNEEERKEILKEVLLAQVSFLGVSEDAYRPGKSQTSTPLQDGVSVIVHGPKTVRIPTATAIPPMTPVVLDIDPSFDFARVNTKRTREEPDRMAFTLKPYNSFDGTKSMRRAMAEYVSSLSRSSGTGNFSPAAITTNGGARGGDVYRNDVRTAGRFVQGQLAVTNAVIETWIDMGIISFNPVASSDAAANAANREAFRVAMGAQLGLTADRTRFDKKLLTDTISRAYLGEGLPPATQQTRGYVTAIRSGMNTCINALHDNINQHLKIIGTVINRNLHDGDQYITAHGRYDVFFKSR